MSETKQISDSKLKKEKDIFNQIVDQTSAIGDEIGQALKSIKEVNGRAHMLSTTAKIEANRTGDKGRDFLVVSNSIDELSEKTNDVIDKMQDETIQDIERLSAVIENKCIGITKNRLTDLALTNIRLVDRSLFERAADIRWWATDDILVKALSDNTEEGFANAENRLAEILKSYTVYYDLILCDVEGHCKATGENKFGLSGRHFEDKTWFKNAMDTSDGTDYGFQSVHHSPKINDDYTLVFSCKVHEDGDPQRRVLGVLAAVFKWREFAQKIINETALTEEEKPKTRVLICDDSGNILADSKEKILQEIMNFKGQSDLFKKEKGYVIEKNNNKTQLISHALSPGFEGYKSSQWHSIIIQDIEIISQNMDLSTDMDGSLDSVIELVVNLSDETQKATDEINKINDQTHVLSLNATIEAARVGEEGRCFGVIARFMGELSRQTADVTNSMRLGTRERMEHLNKFLLTNCRQINGERLANLSLTNVDLIDRALYERTADVRWWATDHSLVQALTLKTEDSKNFLTTRLRTLLQYYVVYDDLIVADNDGIVVSNGSDHNSFGFDVSNQEWFKNARKTSGGQEYSFDLIKPQGEGDEIRLVFSCKIHRNGDPLLDSVGVLAIVFKWSHFADVIFSETPLDDSEKENTSMFIADSLGNILAQVNNSNGEITKEDIPKLLLKDTKNYELIPRDGSILLSGHAASVGYEGFATGWHTIIIQPEAQR